MARKAIPPKGKFRRTFIREWRLYRGLTLQQLASRVDMTHGQLSRIERGFQPYTQGTLEALAAALATDPASLIMRNPAAGSDAFWSIWDQAKEGEREQLVAIAKVLFKISA